MSRLIGEHHWYVDGEFAPNGFPRHNNGFGVRRYLRVDGVRDELDDHLNEQATALNLITATAASALPRETAISTAQHPPPTGPPLSTGSRHRS